MLHEKKNFDFFASYIFKISSSNDSLSPFFIPIFSLDLALQFIFRIGQFQKKIEKVVYIDWWSFDENFCTEIQFLTVWRKEKGLSAQDATIIFTYMYTYQQPSTILIFLEVWLWIILYKWNNTLLSCDIWKK